MNGILIIDKPKGMTSHDVVVRIRRILKTNAPTHQRTNEPKVGHGGTLDPLATGVLPILIGNATKLSQEVMKGDKEYIATIKFGEKTDTDDADGKKIGEKTVPIDLEGALRQVLSEFVGKITQIPPKYSAIKKNGIPLYKIARKNAEIEPLPREVVIYEIEIFEIKGEEAVIKVKCQKGTYIRSLARDIGDRLGCYAHIKELKRTLCGKFSIEDAVPLEKFFSRQEVEAMLHAGGLHG